MRPDATVESDHAYPDRIGSTQSHALVVSAPLASGTTQNDPNRTDRSASQNSDRTCFRRLLRLVEFASTRSINPLNTMHRPPWSPAHHEGPPPRRSGVRGGRPRLRATRRSHADAWLRGDARGRDGGVREELAAGVKGVDGPAGGSIQNESYRWGIRRLVSPHNAMGTLLPAIAHMVHW